MKKFFTDPAYRIEACVFAFAVVFAAPMLIYTWTQPWAYRHTSDGLGIAAFPTAFLLGMLLFGVICYLQDYRDAKRGIVPPKSDVVDMHMPATLISAGVAIVSPLFIFLVDPLFYVAVLCLIVLLVGFVKGWKLLVIPTVGLVIFIYVFMIRIADVFFPVTWFF